ncbi:uncharacterized protein TNCV_4677431 [Trichonephila clavipes]|nr:uncharacterized protein TNCV_4677431 [Trichonephila clavipes]
MHESYGDLAVKVAYPLQSTSAFAIRMWGPVLRLDTVHSTAGRKLPQCKEFHLASLSGVVLHIDVGAAVAEWYRYRIMACLVTSSSPVQRKTRRVGQRCTLNLSRAETSSRWCGVVVRRGGVSSGVMHFAWPWFKITWSVAKSPRVTEQCVVNIQSINESIHIDVSLR